MYTQKNDWNLTKLKGIHSCTRATSDFDKVLAAESREIDTS